MSSELETVEIRITTSPSDPDTLVRASHAVFFGVKKAFPDAIGDSGEIETIPLVGDPNQVAAIICRFTRRKP